MMNGHIVCATRGGEGSRAVQIEAVRRAQVSGKPLSFLFVTDVARILGEVDGGMETAVFAELKWMGKTLLHIARQRAQLAEVEAEVVIRQGDVKDEIARYLQQCKADLLLLGAPRGTTANVFGDDAVEQFALLIQETTGVTVEIIRPEDMA